MYVCMYVCIYVCIYVCMYVCMYVNVIKQELIHWHCHCYNPHNAAQGSIYNAVSRDNVLPMLSPCSALNRPYNNNNNSCVCVSYIFLSPIGCLPEGNGPGLVLQ